MRPLPLRCWLFTGSSAWFHNVSVSVKLELHPALRAQGVPPERIEAPRLHHILTSAIGSNIAPVTTTFDLEWDDVLLLCTDGLTKHLTDDEIRQVLATNSSAGGACRRLAGQAVKRGGSDNVTVVVGRLK